VKWSGIGGAANAEKSAQRAAIRLAFGSTRTFSPRGALKAATALQAGQVAGRVVGAVLDPAVPPAQAARLGLDLIDAVDPLATVSFETALPDSVDALQGMSFSGLQSLALAQGLVD